MACASLSIAATREADQDAATDQCYAKAAANLRLMAETMRDVDDDLLLRVAMIDDVTNGLVSQLISALLCAIGFEIEPYASATAFYQSLADILDRAKAKRLN